MTDRYPLRDGIATFKQAQRNTLEVISRALRGDAAANAAIDPSKQPPSGWEPPPDMAA